MQIDHRDSPNVQVVRSSLRANMNLTRCSYISSAFRSPVILARALLLVSPQGGGLSFGMTDLIAA